MWITLGWGGDYTKAEKANQPLLEALQSEQGSNETGHKKTQ